MNNFIDFTNMHWAIAVLVYPITVIGLFGMFMYVGKFFCFSVFENIFDHIEKQCTDEALFSHCMLVLCIVDSVLLWGAWTIAVEIIFIIIAFLSFLLWFFVVGWILFMAFSSDGFIVGGLTKLHRKIHKRKHGA